MADEAVLDTGVDTGFDGGDDGSQDDGALDDVGLDEATDIDAGEDSSDDADTDVDADGTEDDDAVAGDEDPAAPLADGRKMPDSIKKAIASLKPTNPEAAKEIKGLFFANQEYRTVFPKPADAVEAKTLIEEIGGREGIQQIQEEREEWNQIDKSFAEGSADFVKQIAESNPEAFQKTAAHVINEFASRSPEQYGYYANSVAYNTVLREPGVEQGLQALTQLHSQLAEAPWAQQAIASVVNGIVGLKDKAAAFEAKRSSVDPERQKFQQEKTQFETERRANFENGIAEKAESYLKEKMQPELTRVIAGRKVDPEAMKGYQKMVDSEVQRMLGEVPGFADKLEAHYRTGDQKKSIDYIQAQYNRILPQAVKVIEPFLRNIGRPAAQQVDKSGNPVARPAAAGEVVLKEMPERNQIDWSKTTTADVMMGKAVLINGKRARGWMD